jgi:dTMP kinase
MSSGRFVTFEGIEGCGKSTQIKLLSEWLRKGQIKHHVTREPGGTPVGLEIRKILLSDQTESLSPISESLLYLADRFQHIEEVIRPHLDAGDLVLCDRYHDSTLAYQGYARGISMELLQEVWTQSQVAIDPDLTILLDLDPQIGLRRSLEKLRAQNLDESRFEQESLEFHIRVREGFLDLAKRHPDRYAVLDASGTIAEIHQQILGVMASRRFIP